MVLGTFGSTLSDELNRLANGGTYRDMNQMVDDALAAKQWANRENIVPYSTDTVGILNEIAALGPNRQNWFDFNGVCNYLAGTTGLPAAAALRQITTTGDILTSLASFYVDAAVGTNYIPTTASGYLYLPGVTGNYATAPDSAALDVTGDLDIRVKVAPNNWIPSAAQNFVTKWIATGNQRAYLLGLATDGTIQFQWSTNGTGSITRFSDVPLLLDGSTKWIRATLDVDNGASGNTVTFFTSDNGTSWTQLGSAQVNAGTTSVFASTAPLEIGTFNGGTSPLAGRVFRAQVLNGIGGTTVFDANFETAMTAQTVTSFTESSSNAATVTVLRTTLDFPLNFIANGGSAGSLLPTTLGSSTAADSNDAKFLDHTGTNYVYVTGVSGNNLSVPNAAALQITGDIDVRVQVALDDWTPAAGSEIFSKSGSAGNRGWLFNVSTTGQLQLTYSVDGTATLVRTSTVAPTIADGAPLWIRFTLDVDNGASGNDVKFFTSTDGTTWTQLGTTVTNAGTTSIFNSTAEVRDNGASNFKTGKIFRAQIYASIDGTDQRLDIDTSVITTGSATSFTALTNQTVTINRSTSGRKTVAVTQPTWLFGTDDYMEVNNRYMAHSTSDENYVYLSGASGNYMSVADNPPLDITGDIDIQVRAGLTSWASGSEQRLVSKFTSGQGSYSFALLGNGTLLFTWYSDGTTGFSATSTASVGFTAGQTGWVRITLDVNNGAGGNTATFYTSTDGVTWTVLGSPVVQAFIAVIYAGTANLSIGANSSGTAVLSTGRFYRTIIKNGIDGTTVLDANAAVITLPSQTTFTDSSSNAYTVTINKSGVGTFVSTGNYLYLPGINGNYASAPDSAALDITGDIDLRVKLAMDDWTPSAVSLPLGKVQTTSQRSYWIEILTNGRINLNWSTTGSNVIAASSTVAPTVTDGSTLWIRVTLDVDNGAAGNTATFFTSNDGITWTTLGSPVVTAGVTSIFNSTSILEIGSGLAGTYAPLRGKIFRAQVLNGINGTVAFDANFEGSITSLLQTSFTESSSNAATVTINRSGSTYRSAGVIDAGYLYPGATNTFANSTIDYLNFGATDSFTALIVSRQANYTATQFLMSKTFGLTTPGYFLRNATGTPAALAAGFNDATVQVGLPGGSRANLELVTASSVRNTSTDTGVAYKNATAGTTITDTTTGSLETVNTLRISGIPGGNYTDMELYAAAVFRSVLTPAQIRQITNYFANREVYL